MGPDGSIYVSNQKSQTVLRFTGPEHESPGSPLTSWSDIGPGCIVPPRSAHAEGLENPRGIAIGPDGMLYVVDRASRITVWHPQTGKFLRTVASHEDGLRKPIQIIFDEEGRMLVGDRGVPTVWIADDLGAPLRHFIEKKSDRPAKPRTPAKGCQVLECPPAAPRTRMRSQRPRSPRAQECTSPRLLFDMIRDHRAGQQQEPRHEPLLPQARSRDGGARRPLIVVRWHWAAVPPSVRNLIR